MKAIILFLTCFLVAGCVNKSKQKEEVVPKTIINNTVEKNDTLELLLDNQQEEIVVTKESDKKKETSETISFELKPTPRDIPTGEAINSDSLSIRTEYDYYPLSTTKIKVIITNHSHYEYDCGEGYSLAYLNEKQNAWESLPTNPIINSILWIFPPENPTHEQTIELYTSEVPNRPGKYRIYKTFNNDIKVAFADFELVDEAGAKRLQKKMVGISRGKSISAQNIYYSSMRGDSIHVGLINNSIHFQELFRKEILNYSAINFGKVHEPSPFTQQSYTDTLQIEMKTEKPVYPIGTESVKVILTNDNLAQQNLFFGESYSVVRQQGKHWYPLNANNIVNSVGIYMKPHGKHEFKAMLNPLFNDNQPGIYRVIKQVGFEGSPQEWYMAAEFRIE